MISFLSSRLHTFYLFSSSMPPTTPTIFLRRLIHYFLVLTHFIHVHCTQISLYHQTNLFQFHYVRLNFHFNRLFNYGFVACTHWYLSIHNYCDFIDLSCCQSLRNQATNFRFRPSDIHASNCINLFHLIFLTISS